MHFVHIILETLGALVLLRELIVLTYGLFFRRPEPKTDPANRRYLFVEGKGWVPLPSQESHSCSC